MSINSTRNFNVNAYQKANVNAAICQIGYGLNIDTEFTLSSGDILARFDMTLRQLSNIVKLNPHFKRVISHKTGIAGTEYCTRTKYSKALLKFLKGKFNEYNCWKPIHEIN